jgi:hypothetical protein
MRILQRSAAQPGAQRTLYLETIFHQTRLLRSGRHFSVCVRLRANFRVFLSGVCFRQVPN